MPFCNIKASIYQPIYAHLLFSRFHSPQFIKNISTCSSYLTKAHIIFTNVESTWMVILQTFWSLSFLDVPTSKGLFTFFTSASHLQIPTFNLLSWISFLQKQYLKHSKLWPHLFSQMTSLIMSNITILYLHFHLQVLLHSSF